MSNECDKMNNIKIKDAFTNGKAFIGFLTGGDPTIEKTIEFKDFNCDKLHLYSANDENGRVFVKEIKFVL